MNAKRITTILATGVLAAGVAACGDDEQTPGASVSANSEQAQQATPEPVAEVTSLDGRTTEVALDAGFVDALEQLELTPAPVGEGAIEDGSAVFPITGGNVTYYEPGTVSPFVQGRIEHQGSGLSLSGGGTTVELTDFVIDPGASVLTGTVSVDGEQAATDAPLFFLDGRTLEPLRTTDDGRAILEGTTVKLKAEAAELLNQTFGVDALQEGLVIGTAKITIDTGA